MIAGGTRRAGDARRRADHERLCDSSRGSLYVHAPSHFIRIHAHLLSDEHLAMRYTKHIWSYAHRRRTIGVAHDGFAMRGGRR